MNFINMENKTYMYMNCEGRYVGKMQIAKKKQKLENLIYFFKDFLKNSNFYDEFKNVKNTILRSMRWYEKSRKESL